MSESHCGNPETSLSLDLLTLLGPGKWVDLGNLRLVNHYSKQLNRYSCTILVRARNEENWGRSTQTGTLFPRSQDVAEIRVFQVSLVVHTNTHTVNAVLGRLQLTINPVAARVLANHEESQCECAEQSSAEADQNSGNGEHVARGVLRAEEERTSNVRRRKDDEHERIRERTLGVTRDVLT